MRKRNPGEVVGIIGDTHIPYTHRKYLGFVRRTFEEQGVTRVIHIGDLVDHHALSFHDSEPMLKGASGERLDARRALEPWFEAFPKMEIIKGNHDRIPARQIKKLGMDPDIYLRSNAEIYGFPPGWVERDYVFSNGVLYHHGETAVADFGFGKDARERMCNTVSGHAHGNFGVAYTATDHRLVFGMGVGCGIDVRSMAFAYGRHFKRKPIVGCGVVLNDGKLPVAFPMWMKGKP